MIFINNLTKVFYSKECIGYKFGGLFPTYEEKEIVAVQGISTCIDCGEITAFIGINGAGKSTIIKMLCGLLKPSSGEIYVNSLCPLTNRKKLSKNIGVFFWSTFTIT